MADTLKTGRKIEFNPLSRRFTLVSEPNFSYHKVPTDETLEIYNVMQMVVYGNLTVDGDILADGDVIINE